MKSETLKFTLAIIAVLGAVGFYSYSQVVGNTFFNVTITSNPDLENGLVGHWTFDGKYMDNTTAIDSSVSGNDGVLTGFQTAGGGDLERTDIGEWSGAIYGAGPFSTGSFTPPDDSLLVVVVYTANDTSGNVDTVLDVSGGSLTWTKRAGGELETDWSAVQIWTAPVTTGASMTVTGDIDPYDVLEWHIHIFAYTGYDTDSPVGGTLDPQQDQVYGSPVSFSDTLSSAPAETSEILSAWAADELDSYTGAASYTQLYATDEANLQLRTQYLNSTTSDEVQWASVQNSYPSGAAAVEIKAGTSTVNSTIPGRIGQALEFDGSSNFVAIDTDLMQTSGTFSAWFRPSTVDTSAQSDGVGFIFAMPDFENGNRVYIFQDDGTIRMRLGSSGETGTLATVAVDTWYLLTLSYGGGAYELFIDGNSVATGAYSGLSGNCSINTIGAHRDPGCGDTSDGQDYFEGTIDDVRIYNRVLSADEAKRLYQLGATTHINTTVSSPALQNGLVRHYTFDGGDIDWGVTNELLDVSSSGVDADAVSMDNTKTVIGNIGQALNFDGSTDYGNIATMPTMTEWTIMAWAKAETTVSGKNILSNDRGGWNDDILFGIRPEPVDGADNQWGITHQDSTNSVRTSAFDGSGMVAGRWYHVAAWSDGSDLKLFVDGVEKDSTPKNGTELTFDGAATRIGATPNSFRGFDGDLDDVRVYDRPLSDSEMLRLYQLGATTHINTTITSNDALENGLVGHWTFDGKDTDWSSSTAEVSDRSLNGYDGDATSITSADVVPGIIGQALNFGAGSDVVRISNSNASSHGLDFTGGPFSIATWFNCDAVDGTILGKRDGALDQYQLYLARVAGPHNVYFRAGNETGYGSTVISCGTWYHAVVVVDSSNNPELYINGAQETWSDSTGSRPYIFTHRDVDVSLGARWESDPATSFLLDGQIDETRIYNRALSAGEIMRLYQLGQ